MHLTDELVVSDVSIVQKRDVLNDALNSQTFNAFGRLRRLLVSIRPISLSMSCSLYFLDERLLLKALSRGLVFSILRITLFCHRDLSDFF